MTGLLQSIWAYQRGETAAAALIEAAASRANSLEPWLHAFYYLPKTYTQTPHTGPLDSIPVGVKDIFATKDMPTTNGSPIYADFFPMEDAWIVNRVKELGGTIFGKTVTTEFAWRHPGPTVNPWNPKHTPGGSSSGSAAAVATGILPLALGSQTIGSIVRPAAFNGVVGYKPSYGTIPREGAHPLASSLDHIGFFTNNVADAAAAYALFIDDAQQAVLSEPAWKDYFPALKPPKLAICKTNIWDSASDEQKENFFKQLDALDAQGATLQEFSMPVPETKLIDIAFTILRYEAAGIFADLVLTHADKISGPIKELVETGKSISKADYDQARELQARLSASLGATMGDCDAIITLSATGPAPVGLANTGDPSFCTPWTLLGVPAINLPSGWAENGLPLGLQIVGKFGSDKQTLQIAAWVEATIKFVARDVQTS